MHLDEWSIRAAVNRILDGETPLVVEACPPSERRTCSRAALRQERVGLFTPAIVGQSSVTQSAERPTLVATLNISVKGIGLMHEEALSKYGVIWFNGSKDRPARLVVEQRWTRFREEYSDRVSGFKILGVLGRGGGRAAELDAHAMPAAK